MSDTVWRTVWRWHFYAGLFVVPFILFLSVTGAIYLFKADYERVEEARWRNLPAVAAPVDADAQVAAALARHPGSSLSAYRIPEAADAAAYVTLDTPAGPRELVVSPFGGQVLADFGPFDRFMPWLRELHGKLLLGRTGDMLTELAACWAIVLVLTGVYLWWPRKAGLAGTLWPRLHLKGRPLWRDLHSVTGIWLSALIMVMLLSALPWTGVWGTAFRIAKAQMGVSVKQQDWSAGHEGHVMPGMAHHLHGGTVRLARIVAQVPAGLAQPVMVRPPGARGPGGLQAMDWVARAEPQDRTQVVTYTFSKADGHLMGVQDWRDKSALDKAANLGISWHEGVLLGRFNQAIGVLTALGLLLMAVSALQMWWRRRPDGVLGAPPASLPAGRLRGAMALLCLLALLLPLLGVSLLLVALVEWAVLRRVPATARWLGLVPA